MTPRTDLAVEQTCSFYGLALQPPPLVLPHKVHEYDNPYEIAKMTACPRSAARL
jgi:hypothetical protein